ncbi:GIY-YIG nuclease family protein [Candidatus Woesebacteria bacterium]|nr:GIY-YIG nuclease family protein [Candidatus Woesebacteria bacterium]
MLLNQLIKIPKEKNNLKIVPEAPGIYVFWNNNEPIYIGKAKSLKNRLSSYFNLQLENKTARMVGQAQNFSIIQVTSELESCLLEARLIRIYKPKFNIAAKDDKHPLYIKITKEKYPRVITARKIEIKDYPAFFGPFPNSTTVRSVLKLLRRVFPYSDHRLGKKGCLYSHMGLCNPCPNEIEATSGAVQKSLLRKKYLYNIRIIKNILSGSFEGVRKSLEKSMKEYSTDENFEEAAELKKQMDGLDYITQPIIPTEEFLENPNLFEDLKRSEIKSFRKFISPYIDVPKHLSRIECFDVSHISGVSSAASMVTFIEGEADKKFYRHFRIRQVKGQSDVDSLREVSSRRLKHLVDWGKPDLVMVDGGKPQVSVILKKFRESGISVIGLAKQFETLVFPKYQPDGKLCFYEKRVPRGEILNFVQRIRDEAHRFARRYHHHLLSKRLLSE